MGKGSIRRRGEDTDKYRENYDRIFGRKEDNNKDLQHKERVDNKGKK